MIVTLVDYNAGVITGELAAAICHGGSKPSETGFRKAIKSGHYSLLEHIILSFKISDISRACSHQLVRHRHASYTQKSQRYCEIASDNFWYITPGSIRTSNLNSEYQEFMKSVEDFYNKMINENIPKEDARYILPNATSTTLIMTMNGRAFMEQCSQRLCEKAQWEIRQLYQTMKEAIRDIFPELYELCVPPCEAEGKYCIELEPCGKHLIQ